MEMSKTYQYRKVVKPLLERKRRARINKSLDQLKDLMMECIVQQGDNLARFEKADILELTVEHLRKLKNNRNAARGSFRSGYICAANEVSRALAETTKVNVNLGTKVMTHLGHRLNYIQAPPTTQFSPSPRLNSNGQHSNYQSQLSPAASSGYGSDCEVALIETQVPVSKNSKLLWRPW